VGWGEIIRAVDELIEHGTFNGFAEAAPHGELNAFFRDDSQRRSEAR
jgi:hypothetical protein